MPLGAGDRVDGLGVEVEQLGQRGGVGHGAVGSLASSLTRTVGSWSSLSTTRRTVCRISARVASSRSGSRAASRSISASTTSVAIERSATTVGVTLACRRAARKAAISCATMARTSSTPRGRVGALELLGQRGEAEHGDTRQLGGRRVDVVRQGQVDEGQRADGVRRGRPRPRRG